MYLLPNNYAPRLKFICTIRGMASPQLTLAERFRELRQPTCAGYGAKVQVVCEVMWQTLEHEPTAASAHVDEFIGLLEHGDNLLLAKLVIPELRYQPSTSTTDLKEHVLKQLQRPPERRRSPPSRSVIREAHDLHQQETATLDEVDWHRAGILLYNRGNLSNTEKLAVDEWLRNAPGRHTSVSK